MMKYCDQFEITFLNRQSNDLVARATIKEFVSKFNPSAESVIELETIVSEAITNAVRFAYPNRDGNITVRCRALPERVIEIMVRDKGVGIKNVNQAMQPLFTTSPDFSGMGFTIMETFTYEMRVKSEVGKGTTIWMRKQI